ncbi:LOW QUALITY PROTEIN: serine/threonine-protein kinase Nek10 [Sylvia borin]
MPDQDKKLKSTEKTTEKPSGISMRNYSDLKRPESFLSIQSSNQQSLNQLDKNLENVKSNEKSSGQWQESTEAVELVKFSMTYKNERNFSKCPKCHLFQDIFTALGKDRLTCRSWFQALPIHFLRVLICLRLLIRDSCSQEMLHSLSGIENLSQYMETVANHYLNYGEEQHNVDDSVNMTYIFQKLAAVRNQREWGIASRAHKTLVNFLSARDSHVFFGALPAFLAENPECREKISELTIFENLLVILDEYDFLSKRDASAFGLAKQKQENCKRVSVVGTILYSCPEVVKGDQYGEKADVWAAGCILYQMASLSPPFHSTNMLSLATKIVGAVYEPVPEGLYSEKVSFTIKREEKKLPSAGIDVTQRKVRQISDPVQQILIQLHKIIFITQLPPTLCNLKKEYHQEIQKSLFNQSNPCNLKSKRCGSPFTSCGQVSLLSEGNKELSSKKKILNKGFGIVPDEVNLPVLQQRLITKGSSFAY